MSVSSQLTIGNDARRPDSINELTFEAPAAFTALASSPSVSLQVAVTFVPGDTFDGDLVADPEASADRRSDA